MKRTKLYWPILILCLAIFLLLTATWKIAYAGNNGGSDLSFSGTNQVVINAQPNILNLGLTGYTLEAWVFPTITTGSLHSIIRRDRDYTLYINATGNLEAEVFPGGSTGPNNFLRETGSTVLSANTWYHVAAVWNGTNIRLYVNGSLISSFTDTPAPYGGAASQLWIGRDQLFEVGFNGLIDEVRIWNTPHTQAQIQSTMFQELPGAASNLVGYWRFNEGSGQTVADSSGTGNDGTLGLTPNDPTWVPSSTAPLGVLTYQNGVAGMWAGVPNTAADGVVTGLDIANVNFLVDTGDDIIFGHDSATTFHGGVTDNLATTPHAKKRWARLWEIDRNDQGANGGQVDLTFDISDAGGTGNFDLGGSYYLLSRTTGSAIDFAEVLVVSSTVSGDQVTFRVDVNNLGSEFTLGATAGSPTAVIVQNLAARVSEEVPIALPAGLLLLTACVGVGLVWRLRRART